MIWDYLVHRTNYKGGSMGWQLMSITHIARHWPQSYINNFYKRFDLID